LHKLVKKTEGILGINVSTKAMKDGWCHGGWKYEGTMDGWMEIWPQVYKCIFDTLYAWWL
jgi:hypothetical protein